MVNIYKDSEMLISLQLF